MWIDDQLLQYFQEDRRLICFVPKSPVVVLGRSNKLDREVDSHYCRQHDIPVLRRYGGGGTVVLYPGCVVVSYACWVMKKFRNDLYFRLLNSGVAQALMAIYPGDIKQAGISDLVVGNRKVAGTSLFRSGNYLLYQASIICQLDTKIMALCLADQPERQPEYRQGRSHEDFLVGLEIAPQVVLEFLTGLLENKIAEQLNGEYIEPVASQFKNLQSRLGDSVLPK